MGIRLHRSLYGRVVGGARLQPLVALFVVLLPIRLIVLAAGASHDQSLPIGATALVLLAFVVVLLAGATGWAEADDAGVRWRYYLRHQFGWHEIEQIRLVVKGVSIGGVLHQLVVRAGGRDHVVIPAHAAGSGRVAFGRQLLAEAGRRGIAVQDNWG